MSDGVTLKGRERELASLQRVLDPNGPRVVFVYGVAGIGKSAVLNAFASGL
jgi:AAA+ ATPase superfamily predicted ATPase